MKLSTSVLLLSAILSEVNGRFKDQVADAEATFNAPKETDSDGDTVNVIVRTKNARGSEVAGMMALSVNAKVERHNMMGLTVRRDQLDDLRRDQNFVSVEFDAPMHALGDIDNYKKAVRELAEETPYGIPMVLQDLGFWESLGTPPGSAKVCVADTGYGLGHEDLPIGNDVDGTDSPSNGSWDSDGHGHGSHCSGTVAGKGDNGKGVVGVIPNNAGGKFQLLIGKALSNSGSGSTSGVMKAIDDCVNQGANVISLSLGGGSSSASIEEDYKDYYKNDDVLFVAAAGNGGNTAYSYPASYAAVMSVAAVDSNENKAAFSQWNDQVEISGPGVAVKSTIPTNNYASWSGTSMATPHVAGVAGLLRMHFPECKAYQIREAMLRTAKDIDASGCEDKTGFGLVQAKDAYELLASGYCNTGGYVDPVGGCEQVSCATDFECDDGDATTKDTCVNGKCVNEFFCLNDSHCSDDDPCTQDSCVNNVCISEVSCGSCGKAGLVTVDLTIDNYGFETDWKIKSGNNDVVFEGSNYAANSNTVVSKCFDAGSYKFIITDVWGDGICCSYGHGGYIVSLDGTEVASGGDFGSVEEKPFEVSGAPTPPPFSPTPPPFSPTPPPFSPTPPPNTPTSAPWAFDDDYYYDSVKSICGEKGDPCEKKSDCCEKPKQKCKKNKKTGQKTCKK